MTRARGSYWSDGAAGPVLHEDADWRGRAACRTADPELFFPAAGDTAGADEAKAVCAGCSVRSECLDFALDTGSTDGVFGALDHEERRPLRRSRPRAVPLVRAPKIAPLPRTLGVIPELTEAEAAAFQARISAGGCGSVWAGARSQSRPRGWFQVVRDGRVIKIPAPRLAYKLATGDDPGFDEVQQTCGNQACVTVSCLQPRPKGSLAVQRRKVA